jgi:hypothetical protein
MYPGWCSTSRVDRTRTTAMSPKSNPGLPPGRLAHPDATPCGLLSGTVIVNDMLSIIGRTQRPPAASRYKVTQTEQRFMLCRARTNDVSSHPDSKGCAPACCSVLLPRIGEAGDSSSGRTWGRPAQLAGDIRLSARSQPALRLGRLFGQSRRSASQKECLADSPGERTAQVAMKKPLAAPRLVGAPRRQTEAMPFASTVDRLELSGGDSDR